MAGERGTPSRGSCGVNGDTFLLRQIHPHFIAKDGQVTYLAFRPFPKDKDKLSAYDGSQITAEAAWNHYCYVLNLTSSGVMAVTVDECELQQTRPILDAQPYPEHVSIDFTGLSKREVKNAAKRFAEFAMERGWQYGPVG